jgi:hypothetical protein
MTRLVNFLFKGIDFVIIGDGLIAEVIIALQQTADGVGEVLLGHGSHFKDEGIEPAEGVFHGGKDVALLRHGNGRWVENKIRRKKRCRISRYKG